MGARETSLLISTGFSAINPRPRPLACARLRCVVESLLGLPLAVTRTASLCGSHLSAFHAIRSRMVPSRIRIVWLLGGLFVLLTSASEVPAVDPLIPRADETREDDLHKMLAHVEERLSSIHSLHVKSRTWIEGQEAAAENWEWAVEGQRRLLRCETTERFGPKRQLWFSYDGQHGYVMHDTQPEQTIAATIHRGDTVPDEVFALDEIGPALGFHLPLSDESMSNLVQRAKVGVHGPTIAAGLLNSGRPPEGVGYLLELGSFATCGRLENVLWMTIDPVHGYWPSELHVQPLRVREMVRSGAFNAGTPLELKDYEYNMSVQVNGFVEVVDESSGLKVWLPKSVDVRKDGADRHFDMTYVSLNRDLDASLFTPPMPFGTQLMDVSARNPRTGEWNTTYVGGDAARSAIQAKLEQSAKTRAAATVASARAAGGVRAGQPASKLWLVFVGIGLGVTTLGLWLGWRRTRSCVPSASLRVIDHLR